MNIALVFPPFYFEPMYNMPPLGLINLATVLKGSHEVRIFDFPLAIRQKTLHPGNKIYEDCARKVLDFSPDLVGFSVQCTTYPPALGIAEKLKDLSPGVKIVFGGHNVSFVDEPTLTRFPFIDAIVRGEGEITFRELIEGFEGKLDFKEIQGTTCRVGDHIIRNDERPLIDDLDSLPLSDYSFVPHPSVYRDACDIQRSIAILEIGRGCPHRCIYCSQSLFWRRRTRTFSIDRLIREMQNLGNNFGAECFLLAYDQFTARRAFAEEFCRRVIDAGLNKIPWYCISRLDTVDGELLSLMREAGCESMCYGIDSGSKRTLSFIRKSIDADILLQRVRETTDRQIVPTLSFVIGFPEEQKEDLDDTLQLALQSAAAGNANILVQMATTLPGTELHSRYGERLVREVDTYFSFGIEFDSGKRLAPDNLLIDSDPKLFSSFYNLPCPAGPLGDLNKIASYFSIVASLYPRSFLLLSLELETSVSDLFLQMAARIESESGGGQLTAWMFFDSFEDFAAGLLSTKAALVRTYLPEVIQYEKCLIQAGRNGPAASSFHIDLNAMTDFQPLVNRKIIIRRFPFDMPVIILDAKSGRFAESYPQKTTHLIFRQLQGSVDVREINDFGVDFLRLCDGQRNVDAIAERLYPVYGREKERAEFAQLCAEAARALADLVLVVPGPPAKSGKGGETDASGKGS